MIEVTCFLPILLMFIGYLSENKPQPVAGAFWNIRSSVKETPQEQAWSINFAFILSH